MAEATVNKKQTISLSLSGGIIEKVKQDAKMNRRSVSAMIEEYVIAMLGEDNL